MSNLHIDTIYIKNNTFKKNFWNDFKKELQGLNINNLDKAEEYFNISIKHNPEFGPSNFNLGKIFYIRKKSNRSFMSVSCCFVIFNIIKKR